jgi:hypothetical protein
MDIEWFADRIKEDELDLPYVKPARKGANYIFTATTGQWEDFLKKHAGNKEVFNPKYKFVFRKRK